MKDYNIYNNIDSTKYGELLSTRFGPTIGEVLISDIRKMKEKEKRLLVHWTEFLIN